MELVAPRASTRPFAQVDVFSAEPYRGNPLAVVLDAEGVPDEALVRFANWTNLSETTFLLPPTAEGAAAGADYRVRIFTPSRELPFAGHPTLGSAHAWLEAGGSPRTPGVVVQQCGIGLVRVRRDGDRLAFAAPDQLRSDPLDPSDLASIVDALGLSPDDVVASRWVDNGPGWSGLLLRSASAVLAVEPRLAAIGSRSIGIIGPYPPTPPASSATAGSSGSPSAAVAGAVAASASSAAADPAVPPSPDFEVRGFAGSVGVGEDPVTGSLNASLAQWLIGDGYAPAHYVASQGTRLGRAGRVFIDSVDGDIWVGGSSVTAIRGTVTL